MAEASPYICGVACDGFPALGGIPLLIEFSGADTRGHLAGLPTTVAMNLECLMEGLPLATDSQVLGLSPELGRASESGQRWQEGADSHKPGRLPAPLAGLHSGHLERR